MSDIDTIIDVQVELNSAGIALPGFGTALIVSHNAAFPDLIRSYNQVADAVPDDFAADSPEGLAIAAVLNQSPHPTVVKVGRANATKPTMEYTVGVELVADSTKYEILVEGPSITKTLVSITSDPGDDNDDIVAALVTPLNGVSGANYTASATGSVGSKKIQILGNAAGNWFSIKILKPSLLSNAMVHGDADVDDALADFAEEDDDFYRVILLYQSTDYVETASTWCENNKRTLVFDTVDTKTITTAASGGDDVGTDLLATAPTYISGLYHPRPTSMLSAALDGRILSLNPGTWTAMFKSLVGPEPVKLTPTQRTNLHDRRMGSYSLRGGKRIAYEGMVFNEDYGFLDIRVGVDWLVQQLQAAAYIVLTTHDKIGFTDEDIDHVAAALRGAVSLAVSDEHKVLAPGTPDDPDDLPPSIFFPKVADIDPSVRALRTLPDGLLLGRVQGAVHSVKIRASLVF